MAHGGVYSGEVSTWEWDGSLWTARPDAGLAGRDNQALTYDSGRGVTVLFGGRAHSNVAKVHPVGDTWEWDGDTWSQRQSSMPTLASPHTAVFDRQRNAAFLHFDGYPLPVTWQWKGDVWTVAGVGGPAWSTSAASAFDESREVAVLVGTHVDGYWNMWMSTDEWDGTTWTERTTSGLSPREGHAVTYDSLRRLTLVFGGSSQPYYGLGDLADLWSWDGSEWVVLSTSGPPWRALAAMSYDRARDRVVVFGGEGTDGLALGDTWEWDGSNWSLRGIDGPPPRCQHAMIYDEERSVTVLFGGFDASWQTLDDTWEWDGMRWSQVHTTSPGARGGHTMVYNAAAQCVELFGGSWEPSANHAWELRWNELLQDIDDDCDIDLLDLAAFQTCFGTDLRLGHCERFDADLTGDITLGDFEAFQRKLSGPSPRD